MKKEILTLLLEPGEGYDLKEGSYLRRDESRNRRGAVLGSERA